jgi:hypothetical protein
MTDYQIDIKDNILTFRTTSFKAEKGSMLHSGIYNREMSAILAAGGCIVIAGSFFALRYELTASHFLISLVAFIGFFICFRTFVFKKPLLSFQIDKVRGDATVLVRAFLSAKKAQYRLADLSEVRINTIIFEPQNADGIKLVEQVALQHGTVIPGFGKTAEFHTVEVEFKNGQRIIIFSSEDPAAADDIALKIKNFIER